MKYDMKYKILKESDAKPLNIDEWVSSNILGYKPHINYDLDCISDAIIRLKTEDKELPYLILSTNDLDVAYAPQLESFKNFPNHAYNLPLVSFRFAQTNNLNFSEFYKTIDEIDKLTFVDVNNINPQDLKNINIKKLTFNVTRSNHVLDISNYKNLNVLDVLINESSITSLKNISVFFEGDLLIDSFSIDYNGLLSNSQTNKYKKFQDIMISYFNGKTSSYRVEHSMDATMELIDNGFEDEL